MFCNMVAWLCSIAASASSSRPLLEPRARAIFKSPANWPWYCTLGPERQQVRWHRHCTASPPLSVPHGIAPFGLHSSSATAPHSNPSAQPVVRDAEVLVDGQLEIAGFARIGDVVLDRARKGQRLVPDRGRGHRQALLAETRL